MVRLAMLGGSGATAATPLTPQLAQTPLNRHKSRQIPGEPVPIPAPRSRRQPAPAASQRPDDCRLTLVCSDEGLLTDSPHAALASSHANVLELRPRDRGRLRFLSSLRRGAGSGCAHARAAEDRNRPLLRRDGLDLTGGVGRPGGAPEAARPLLRRRSSSTTAGRWRSSSGMRSWPSSAYRCSMKTTRFAPSALWRRCATRCPSSAFRRGSASPPARW